MTSEAPGRLKLGRSIAAILIAILLNVAFSIGLDAVFHMAGVYPPMDQGMFETSDNLLALSYRLVITVFANVVGLRVAGYALRAHAIALGLVGLALGTFGAVVTTMVIEQDLGPDWYPWSLAASAIPCAWVAWAIAVRRAVR
jgi:hypothetical protein